MLGSSLMTEKNAHSHQDLINLEKKRIINLRTSLMVLWIRIGLPVQQTWAHSLVWKIPHAAEQLSLCATTTEPKL